MLARSLCIASIRSPAAKQEEEFRKVNSKTKGHLKKRHAYRFSAASSSKYRDRGRTARSDRSLQRGRGKRWRSPSLVIGCPWRDLPNGQRAGGVVATKGKRAFLFREPRGARSLGPTALKGLWLVVLAWWGGWLLAATGYYWHGVGGFVFYSP